jgi:2-dehydro-3-deoxyphosphogluconate aldolase/(4S)-4-hydroxy-2-oxoglutarate aldolase
MRLLDRGYALQKFFPAEPSGGAAYLGALASPLPQVRFCPTGGITAETAVDYLRLRNVAAVGGSWMAPARLVSTADWLGIERLARQAVHALG